MFSFPNFIHKNLRGTTLWLSDYVSPWYQSSLQGEGCLPACLVVDGAGERQHVLLLLFILLNHCQRHCHLYSPVLSAVLDVSQPVQTWCWCRSLQWTRWLVGSPARSHRHHISILYAGWSFLRLYKQPSCQIKLRPGNSYQQLSYNNIIQLQPFQPKYSNSLQGRFM